MPQQPHDHYLHACLWATGAVAAALVGTATQASSIRAPATLFAFFLSSSKLTKLKEELKSGTEDFKAGGQRDWKQVSNYMW